MEQTNNYRPRIADELLDLALEESQVVLVKGPRGCGKTKTAKNRAETAVEFQDEEAREGLLMAAGIAPQRLLLGDKPILLDEWQEAPKMWRAVRKDVGESGQTGQYIFTSSTSQKEGVLHAGTSSHASDSPNLRAENPSQTGPQQTVTQSVGEVQMLPMSLFESGESNGAVSLYSLFARHNTYDGCTCDLSLDELIFAICRGGWPEALSKRTDRAKLGVAEELFRQACLVDISYIDGVRRNPSVARAVLRSYARNICTPAAVKTIVEGVQSGGKTGAKTGARRRAGTGVRTPGNAASKPKSATSKTRAPIASDDTIRDYMTALQKLFIVTDVPAWCPPIRSKTAVRATKKRNLVDPSLAVAALGLSPQYLNRDFKMLDRLFQCLCLRDLAVYASTFQGRISCYHDRYGLTAGAVLHLKDGRYALVDFALGENAVGQAAARLCKIEQLIGVHDERLLLEGREGQRPLRPPRLKLVLTALGDGHQRPDGVSVVPIGCLKS